MNRLDVRVPRLQNAQGGTELLRSALENMAQFVQSHGDSELRGKFRELAAKLERGLLTVAFCGHFSAGKSTLVNALCGAPLLPASPIPTSANVVTIVDGEPAARLTMVDKRGRVTEERPLKVEQLHEFAADGASVASIEVSYPIELLRDRMAIVDTPGVDSTDSAHRAATESALHLADVVFYVTDYNHVLSDVNFRFLRTLAEWGKPTYVIVNQVDKHREEEVGFGAFRDGLLQAMQTWGIDAAGVLFLSLRKPDHPLSQWTELLSLMRRLPPLRDRLLVRSAERSARHMAGQFRETLRLRHAAERERLMERIGNAENGAAGLAVLRDRLTRELQEHRSAADRRREAIRADLDLLLANANVTPAETRDKAAQVLESLQPGFKVGWLASAAKSEAERERRLALLTDDFNRQITANVNGHVRELLRRAAHEAGWHGPGMESSLEAAFETATAEWLRSKFKPGMGDDGQATLQYAAEISAEIKALYRKQALQWAERLEERRAPERQTAEARLKREFADLELREQAAAALDALESAARADTDRLLALLPAGDAEPSSLPLPVPASLTPITPEAADVTPLQPVATGTHLTVAEAGLGLPEFRLGSPGDAVDMLERAANVLSPLPAFAATAKGLSESAARLRDRRFTIALFGAFSAGKSSFANALAGVPALPVSPNPTTATINRIVAPTAEHPHGTASVTMKTRDSLIEDIRFSLRRLGISEQDVQAEGDDAGRLLALAGRIPAHEMHPRGKPHLSFLRAAAASWERYAGLLGTRFDTQGEEYRTYAAEEQASCFVAEIDLFVDCPLTRAGAVLVDTPGADSINARHTGVAFEYIKNADAVLFVTYYNHAFTEADRQFLNQLGSVKDVFELDKMFFLINAADLAASAGELEAVKEHVAGQLLKHGIRRPRLFAVSSLDALQAKQQGRPEQMESSGLTAFESSFRSFAEIELGGLATASARRELDRAGKLLDGWIHAAEADAATRDAESRKLLRQAEEWRREGASDVPTAATQPLAQEIAEQLYHLRQRIRYRFGDHFISAFHPSVLQDDGRDLKKMLEACWEDLKRGVGEDLLQELRSAGLRLEGHVKRVLQDTLAASASARTLEGFVTLTGVHAPLQLPYTEPFADGPQWDRKRLWPYFKSPKHFFEKEGSSELREAAADVLFAQADDWLTILKERWMAAVSDQLEKSLAAAYEELARELAAYAQSLGESLHRPEERPRLSAIQAEWRSIVRDYGVKQGKSDKLAENAGYWV